MKKFILPLVIISIVLILLVIGYFYLVSLDEMEYRYYDNLDTNADFMVIIEDNQKESPLRCIVIENRKEIRDFLSAYKWRDSHLMCCGGAINYDPAIISLKNNSITNRFYFVDFMLDLDNPYYGYNPTFQNKIKKYVDRFNTETAFSYKYTVSIPLSVDYETLKQQLLDDNGFYVFSHLSNNDSMKYSFSIISAHELTVQEIDVLYDKHNMIFDHVETSVLHDETVVRATLP